jgi:hypothetical protein
MKKVPYKGSYSAFLESRYDRLFAMYQEESRIRALIEALDRKEALRAAIQQCVRLVGGSAARPEWVELRPQTQRQGVVLAGNVFRPGTVVRSKIPWSHALRPRTPGLPHTWVAPRWLRAVGTTAPAPGNPGSAEALAPSPRNPRPLQS